MAMKSSIMEFAAHPNGLQNLFFRLYDGVLVIVIVYFDGVATYNLFSVLNNLRNQTTEPLKHKESKKVDVDYESNKSRKPKEREVLTIEQMYIKIFGYNPSLIEILFPV